MHRTHMSLVLVLALACGDKDDAFSTDGDSGGTGADGADGTGSDGTGGDGTDGTTELVDADGDGFYDYQDCDDTDDSVYPGAEEVAYDGIDQDCNGFDLLDFDDDGFDSDLYGGEDCNDEDPSVYPGAEDVENGIDDDCDGELDEDLEIVATDWPIRFGDRDATVTLDSLTTTGNGVLVTYGSLEGEPDMAPTTETVERIVNENGSPDLYLVGINADRSQAFVGGVHAGGAATVSAGTVLATGSDLYITGTFTETLDFEVEPPEYTRESQGDEDVFLAKYDDQGTLVWAASAGGSGTDILHDAALRDGVYAGGSFTEQFDVWNAFSWTSVGGGGTTSDPESTLALTGLSGGWVTSWDNEGETSWTVGFQGTSATDEAAVTALGVTPSGTERLVVAGTFVGSIDLDPGAAADTVSASDGTFLAALDNSGALIWGTGLEGDFTPHDLDVDSSGTVFVAGELTGSLSVERSVITSNGGADALVLVFDASGNYSSHVHVGGSGDDRFTGVGIDGAGGFVVGGEFEGSVTVSSSSLTSNGDTDCMAAHVTSGGSVAWAYGFGGVADEQCGDVAYGQGDGYAYVSGLLYGLVDFGLGSDSDIRRAYGLQDGWVHRLGL